MHWLGASRRHRDRHAGAPSVQPARPVAAGLGDRARARHAEPLRLRDRSCATSGAAAPTPRIPSALAALAAQLAPRVDPASDANKQRLREATDAALARGVFGVPTLGIGDKLFWGFDALDMAAAFVRGDPWFDEPHWQREGAPRPGVVR